MFLRFEKNHGFYLSITMKLNKLKQAVMVRELNCFPRSVYVSIGFFKCTQIQEQFLNFSVSKRMQWLIKIVAVFFPSTHLFLELKG